MEKKTRTRAPGPLAKLRAWLRGDRFMVDSRPPTPVAPATDAEAPAREG